MTDYPQTPINSYNPEPPKNNTTKIIIIVVVVLIVLCCCCSIGGYLLWTYGDQLANSLGLY